MFKRKVILITGITGTLGQELTRQLLPYNPSKIIGISRRDTDQELMDKQFNSPLLRFHIGDVRNYERLVQSMKDVDYVIHTSASKQIHRGEVDPLEYKSNITDAAECVIKACVECGVEKCVALSTDKSTAACSVYGSSKLLSDRLFLAANNCYPSTKFSVIRYGNVINSNGSVVKNIKTTMSKVLKITNSEMTRFWVNIERAAELTIHLLKYSNGGELLMPKLPSCNIVDFLTMVNPNTTTIEIIGERLGEKLHESLFTKEDSRRILEFSNYYLMYNSLPNTHDRAFAGEVGHPIKYIEYDSFNNPWKLTKSDIKALINGTFSWNEL